MFYVTLHEYVIGLGPPPLIASSLQANAGLYDVLHDEDGAELLLTVKHVSVQWPILVVSLRPKPGPESAFHPGVLLVPETQLLLVGAGTRLAAYNLGAARRLWVDTTDAGFWGWERHGAFLVMSAELELATWDLFGNKIWSTVVEPPWEYEVRDAIVYLDVMGQRSHFPLASGPVRVR